MIRVLFVDDEPAILRSLSRLLRVRKVPWEIELAETGTSALRMLASARFDIVFADLRTPEQSGIEILGHVYETAPGVARVILSGQVGTTECLAALRVAHQCLAKPCSVDTLRRVVDQIVWSRELLADPELIAGVAAIRCLPSAPAVWQEACAALERGAPVAELGAIIDSDVALAAKLVQISGALLAHGPFEDRDELIADAGSTLLDPSVFASGNGAVFAAKLRPSALAVARVAKAIAPPELAHVAYLTGLVHDIGKLAFVEIGRDPEAPQAARAGAYLLALWGFDRSIVEAIAFQDDAGKSADHALGAILRAARHAVYGPTGARATRTSVPPPPGLAAGRTS